MNNTQQQEPRVHPNVARSVRAMFEQYKAEIELSDRALNTKHAYVAHASRFVRWLEGRTEV